MPFLDVDRGIEQRIGDQTLTAFYKEVGEEGFRPIETDVVVEMCTTERAVIAFGAGSLMRARNQQAATENSLVVYLQVPVAELWQRIQSDPAAIRPDPTWPEEVWKRSFTCSPSASPSTWPAPT